MKYCQHCGAEVSNDNNFCPTCGGPLDNKPMNKQKQNQSDVDIEKIYAIISYIGFLGLIFHFAKIPKTSLAKFHALQASNLFIIEFIFTSVIEIVAGLFRVVNPFIGASISSISWILIIFNILGIVYAFQDKKEELPIIKDIKIIK